MPNPPPCTVYQAFRETAERYSHHDFLVVEATTAQAYGIPARTIQYSGALQEIDRLAACYRKAGYGVGHRVGLLLENRPEFFLHWIALNCLGASVVPISAEWRAAELSYLIEHSEIGLAVTIAPLKQNLNAVANESKAKLVVVTADSVAQGALPPASRPCLVTEPNATTECALLYTSGTTGRPKGCILRNEYFLCAGVWYNTIGGLCTVRPGKERLITPLPLTHMNAMACSTMAMILSGGAIVQLDRFHPSTWWQSVRDSGATIIHYLGIMPAMLLGAAPTRKDRTDRVRFGFGAGVDRKNHGPFEQRFGFPLLEAWAMTETGTAAAIIANREPRHVGTACFGQAEAAVDWRIVDDSGADVSVDQPGELLVRAAGEDPRRGFFAGYLKDAGATNEAWAGSYFHTGDIVRRDAAGNFYFVDRKKNVIRRGGENISAVEVESVLLQHPAVRVAAVAATPDAIRGDEVLACIVTKREIATTEMEQTAQEIVEFALSQLTYYKVPGYVAFVDSIPLTPSQKIQRADLKRLANDLPGTARCVDTRALKKRQSTSTVVP